MLGRAGKAFLASAGCLNGRRCNRPRFVHSRFKREPSAAEVLDYLDAVGPAEPSKKNLGSFSFPIELGRLIFLFKLDGEGR